MKSKKSPKRSMLVVYVLWAPAHTIRQRVSRFLISSISGSPEPTRKGKSKSGSHFLFVVSDSMVIGYGALPKRLFISYDFHDIKIKAYIILT